MYDRISIVEVDEFEDLIEVSLMVWAMNYGPQSKHVCSFDFFSLDVFVWVYTPCKTMVLLILFTVLFYFCVTQYVNINLFFVFIVSINDIFI